MPLSVRLDKKTESLLDQTASTLKTSKAEVIKRSLSDYCGRILTEKRKRPYELIKDLLGKGGAVEVTFPKEAKKSSEKGSGEKLDSYRYRSNCRFV